MLSHTLSETAFHEVFVSLDLHFPFVNHIPFINELILNILSEFLIFWNKV